MWRIPTRVVNGDLWNGGGWELVSSGKTAAVVGFSDCSALGTGGENCLSVEVLGPAEPLICKLHRKEEGYSPWRLSPWQDRDTHLPVWSGPLLAHAEPERDKKGWKLKKISRKHEPSAHWGLLGESAGNVTSLAVVEDAPREYLGQLGISKPVAS